MAKLRICLVLCILFLGLVLRLHNYEIYPQRGATSDEYSYSFQGVSLWTKHIPISWSAFTPYKNISHLTIDNLYFPIVYPYFDHPPLNALLVGGWALLFGQDEFPEIELKTIRLVPIFLSMISSVFVFLLGFRLYTFKTGVWGLLIYSTTAIFIMNGRVVFAENLITPLLLIATYLFYIHRKSLDLKKTIIIGVICGLSFLAKEMGIAVFLSMIYLFITERIKAKIIFVLITTSLFFVLLYVLYGMYYDWELFKAIIFLQSSREIGPGTLLYLTSTPIIVNKIYYDGWYFLGFISFFISTLDYQKNRFVLVPAFIYFFLLIFSLTQKGEMGWYLIPLFPFMALFSADILVKHIDRKSWAIFLLLVFVGLYEVENLFKANFGLTPTQFRTILILMFVPFFTSYFLNKERIFQWLGNAWFYILIIGNILISFYYVHPA